MKEVTGNLQIKNGKYYVLLNLYVHSEKRTIKWVSLSLDKKSGKKLARIRMSEVIEEYNSAQQKLMRKVSKKKNPERFISERERIQSQTLVDYLTDWVELSRDRIQNSYPSKPPPPNQNAANQ